MVSVPDEEKVLKSDVCIDQAASDGLEIWQNIAPVRDFSFRQSCKMDYLLPIRALFSRNHASKDEVMVSIIITAYNNWDFTYACLYAVLKNTQGVSYEVIVVDDCSSDETRFIGKYVKNVVYLRNFRHCGFAAGCNKAARTARGRYLLFLNSETNVQKNWLKPMIDLAEKDFLVGIVGSKIVDPNGKLQQAGGIVWNDASGHDFGIGDDPGKSQYNYLKEVDYVSSASFLISRKLWDEIGGFDLQYVQVCYEGMDLAFEARKRGYKVVYHPRSAVVFFGKVPSGSRNHAGLKTYQLRNQERFLRKWVDTLMKENFSLHNNFFHARDRSRNKRTVLVFFNDLKALDDKVSMELYCKILKEYNFNIKLLVLDPGGEGYLIRKMQLIGVETIYDKASGWDWHKWIEENAGYLDYLYIGEAVVYPDKLGLIAKRPDLKILNNYTDIDRLERS